MARGEKQTRYVTCIFYIMVFFFFKKKKMNSTPTFDSNVEDCEKKKYDINGLYIIISYLTAFRHGLQIFLKEKKLDRQAFLIYYFTYKDQSIKKKLMQEFN